MSKTRIFALITFTCIIACVLTNPPREEFEKIIKAKAKELMEKQLHYKDKDAIQLGMTLFGDKIIQDFMARNIVVKNYYLFSIANLNWENKQTPIGGGAFTTVWLSPKIDEKASEIIGILKNL